MMFSKWALGALMPLLIAAKSGPITGQEAFDKMASLVGRWEAKTKSGKTIRVSYKMIAGGSVLAETWESPSGRVSMTMFHLDDSELMLTHYCPQGNQPRLLFAPGASERDTLVFRFKDATNLADKRASHMHATEFRIGAKALVRSDTYLSKGKPDIGTLTFTRAP